MSEETRIDGEYRLEAEETLRLLATLSPPEELTGRVHARVRSALATQGERRRGFWSYWQPAQRMQFAAAALLAVAVAGSTWGLYRRGQTAAQPSVPAKVENRIQPGGPDSSSGAFGSAKTSRVPPTLNPIKVPPAPHRKPGAGHAAAKRAPKPAVSTAAPAVVPNP